MLLLIQILYEYYSWNIIFKSINEVVYFTEIALDSNVLETLGLEY